MAKLSIHAYVHCSVHSNDCFTMHFTSICLVTINLIIVTLDPFCKIFRNEVWALGITFADPTIARFRLSYCTIN